MLPGGKLPLGNMPGEYYICYMKVEIFTITFNSMYIMPFFIEHYRERFPDVVINVYDDGSSDNTTSYCRNMGCNVVDIEQTNDCLSTEDRLKWAVDVPNWAVKATPHITKINTIRDKYWRNSTADWVIVVDHDELVDVWEKDLVDIQPYDVIVFEGYNMYNETQDSTVDVKSMKYAISKETDKEGYLYNKPCMLKSNMNFEITGGGHNIITTQGLNLHNAIKELKICNGEYKLYHYPKRFLSKENYINYFKQYIALPEKEYIHNVEKTYHELIRDIKLVKLR
jgi:hypothetical protein